MAIRLYVEEVMPCESLAKKYRSLAQAPASPIFHRSSANRKGIPPLRLRLRSG